VNWKWPLIWILAAVAGGELGCAIAKALGPARQSVPTAKTFQVFIKPGDEGSQGFACFWMDAEKTVLGCGDVEVFIQMYESQDSGVTPQIQRM
jgi:hypothetical protein